MFLFNYYLCYAGPPLTAKPLAEMQKPTLSNCLLQNTRKHKLGKCKTSDLPLNEKVLELKQQAGKDIAVGSRSLIIQLLNSNLIDEFQICIHPIIEGKGLRLFDQIKDRITLKLNKTKTLNSGATILFYEPIRG